MIKKKDTINGKYKLTPEEDREMDFICNAIIDLMLSDPERYLYRRVVSKRTEILLADFCEYMGGSKYCLLETIDSFD